jgi:hypothetical protein
MSADTVLMSATQVSTSNVCCSTTPNTQRRGQDHQLRRYSICDAQHKPGSREVPAAAASTCLLIMCQLAAAQPGLDTLDHDRHTPAVTKPLLQ